MWRVRCSESSTKYNFTKKRTFLLRKEISHFQRYPGPFLPPVFLVLLHPEQCQWNPDRRHMLQAQGPCSLQVSGHRLSCPSVPSPSQVCTLTAASDRSSSLTSVGSTGSRWCTTCAPQSAPLPTALPPRAPLPRASLTLRMRPASLHTGCRKSFWDNGEPEGKTGRKMDLKSNHGMVMCEPLVWRAHEKLSSSPCRDRTS